jgi:hypothetical protein
MDMAMRIARVAPSIHRSIRPEEGDMKRTANQLRRRRRLAIASETLALLTLPQLCEVVGGSVDCHRESYARGECPSSPHTGEEEG